MVKILNPKTLHKFALATLMLVPATAVAESYNMPQFGRVEKQVTEEIDFYDMKGTDAINSSSSNNSFATVVFKPAAEGEAIQITFSKINLKGDGAGWPTSLSIFNGEYNEDITYPTTASGVQATDFPDNGKLLKRYYSEADKTLIDEENVTFTSTDPDGSLSVCFLYKYAATCDGWEAKVKSVTLTDQEIISVTPDYSGTTADVYPGLKEITLGAVNVTTTGILNPFKATSISFDLDDANNALENISLSVNGNEVDAEPAITGNSYVYTLDNELVSGDNIFTVKADVATTAPFYSTASLTFTGLATTDPNAPAMAGAQPATVTVAALVMMPTDGSHLTTTIEEGKSVLFYDNGGPSDKYTANTSGIVTFKPAEGAEGKVMIDFTSLELFNTNPARNDKLVVYNGTEVDADQELVTLLTQTKATVRSTSPDGALTVSFSTTTGVPKAGWEATASLFTPTAMTLVGTDASSAAGETVAAGDTDCQILKVLIKTKDTEPAMTLSGISFDFNGTSAQWEKVKVYSSGNKESFDISSATLLGEGSVTAETLALSFTEQSTLSEGDNFLWILADVKADAQSGTKVNAIVKTVTLNGQATEVTAPASETGREVYNLVYPSTSHPVKTVYGSMAVAHTPYSAYYTGYEGTTNDLLVTFIPANDGYVCEVDFSKLNLYFYESQYYPSSNVTPVFKVFAGQTTDGTLLYTHEKANNVAEGEDNSAIGTIRSTSADGALTILFNAGTTSSTYTKSSEYGFLGEVREYQSRPMAAQSAEAFASGITSVAVSTATDVPVIGVKVTTEGNLNPLTLDNISFGLKADPSIYTSLRLASSGHKTSASGAEVIATADAVDGVVTFNPAATLSEGDNIFWLIADVSAGAAPGSVIDAKVNALTVAGTAMTVTNADPEGEILTVNTYDPVLGDKDQVVEVGEYPILINGVTAGYMTNEYTITAKPALEGGKVTATFTEGSFNVNTANQYITVIGGAEAFGVDAETVYPVSVTSAREDGQLIIEYHSTTIAKEEGWKCELTCDARQPLVMSDFEALTAGSGKGTAGSETLLYGMKFTVTGDKDDITLTGFDFDIPAAGDIFSELNLYATGEGEEFLRNDLVASSSDLSSATLVPAQPLVISTAGTYHFWLQGVVKTDAANAASTTITPAALNYSVNDTGSSVDLSGLTATTFQVVGGFHGTYNIGTSAEAAYGSFADALADMAPGIDGPVTLIVEPGTYNELVELDHIPGVSSANTITISGQSGDPSDVVLVSNNWVEPPYSEDKLDHYYGVLTLRGTSNVTIEGMTIRTTSVEFPSVVHIADGASDITISGCVISAPTSTTTYNNLTLVNSYVNMTTSSVNNRLTVTNSDLTGGYVGIKSGSGSINQPECEGVTITGCSFSNQGYQAIYLYFTKDVTIARNLLTGSTTSSDKNYCQMIDLDISGPATIERNILDYAKTGTYGMYLRRLAGSEDAPVIIANNILDIDVDTKPGAGIQLYNSTSKPFTGFLLAHNTVRTSGSDVVMPLIINVNAGTTVDGRIANNIWQNEAGYYVIKEQYGPSGATYLNNVGYTSRSDSGYAYWGGSYDKEMTFNQWTLESGETGSVNASVSFDNSDETKPLYPASFADLKGGTPLSEVTVDFLGTPRDTSAPTIGAYEASATSAIDQVDSSTIPSGKSLFATDRLSVEAENADIRIYSLSGMLLMQTHVNGRIDLNVSGLPRGLCILAVGDRATRLFLR